MAEHHPASQSGPTDLTEMALRESEERFRAAFEQAAVGMAHFDREGRCLRVNAKYCQMLGYRPEELKGKRFVELTHPADQSIGLDQSLQLRTGELDQYSMEKRYCHKDGRVVWAQVTISAIRGTDGHYRHSLAIMEDISARKATEQARREAEQRLALAVGIAGLGFWEWNLDTDDLYWSPGYKKQLGYADHELLPSVARWEARLHPEDRARLIGLFAHLRQNQPSLTEFTYRLRHRDGHYRWFVSRASPVHDGSGRASRIMGSHLDITDQKHAEQRIREAAQHDMLTGLPNRALVFEYTAHLLAGAARTGGQGAILFVDLDRFKPVNDLYGHETGDQLLREVAHRLRGCTRAEDLVGRLGGDEFIVVLPYLKNSQQAATAAQHVLENIEQPFALNGLELKVTPSIGISLFPQDGRDVDTLLHAADLAMYQAKHTGRAQYHFYTPGLQQLTSQALTIEAMLKQALLQDGLRLVYQPIIDMKSGDLIGAEALLRLNDSSIGPERFIPIAESAGLIGPLGEWVAAEACRQYEQWCNQGIAPMTIAFNVSPLQFRQKAFADRLNDIVRHSSVDPTCLQIEVTESAVMESVDDAIATLKRIKDLGLRVALDDFGTGYSSLSHLSHLPLDKLKVDQSFVRRIETDVTCRAITEAIIGLGRTLHLETVGEGIESEGALGYLRRHGCDQAQGYLFSRPLPADEFLQWCHRHRQPGTAH